MRDGDPTQDVSPEEAKPLTSSVTLDSSIDSKNKKKCLTNGVLKGIACLVLFIVNLLVLGAWSFRQVHQENNSHQQQEKHNPALCGHQVVRASPPSASNDGLVDACTMHGKIMAGYQGWFDTKCSNSRTGWRHWSQGGVAPNTSSYHFEMWPDQREYDTDELCPTELRYSNDTAAGLFSSFNPKTVERHVRWMFEYGIDGVYVQRFLADVTNRRGLSFRDTVLNHVRHGAEKYGRVFANMYDITGVDEESIYQALKEDWIHLVDVQRITESDRYLHHNGLPVLAIWGFGVECRPGQPQAVADLIDWFQNNPVARYRVTLVGGIQAGWQDRSEPGMEDPAWSSVIRKFDVISPWSVGRYEDEAGANEFRKLVVEPNLVECNRLGISYMPVVFPGYSFSHINKFMESLSEESSSEESLSEESSSEEKPSCSRREFEHQGFNKIPRNGGKFFWRQISNAINAFDNPSKAMLYVAMFDEVDEGTAIFKVAENKQQVPPGPDFVSLDEDGYSVPSDWYLSLVGNATSLLRNQGMVPSTIPVLPPMMRA